MAKKRKLKVKKGKIPRVPARKIERAASPTQAEHVLGFVGGLIVVIAAIVALIMVFDIFAVVSLIIGILIIVLTSAMQKKPRVLAVFLIVLSLLALILPPYGFIIGPLLGIIGAIIVLVRK